MYNRNLNNACRSAMTSVFKSVNSPISAQVSLRCGCYRWMSSEDWGLCTYVNVRSSARFVSSCSSFKAICLAQRLSSRCCSRSVFTVGSCIVDNCSSKVSRSHYTTTNTSTTNTSKNTSRHIVTHTCVKICVWLYQQKLHCLGALFV